MGNVSLPVLALLVAASAGPVLAQPSNPPAASFAMVDAAGVDACNTIFTNASQDETGSIPLGNGNVGINLWVEEDGDLFFYVARNDAISEIDTLLKCGRVRLHLSPNPFRKGMPYRQELKLRQGRCEITAGPKGKEVRLTAFVDAGSSDIRVRVQAEQPTSAMVAYYDWRTDRRDFHNAIGDACYPMRGAPEEVPVWTSADHWDERDAAAVISYHRNEYSPADTMLKWQHMEKYADLVKAVDPIRDNTFGVKIAGRGLEVERLSNHQLRSKQPARDFEFVVTTHRAQTPDAETWIKELEAAASAAPAFDEAQARTEKYWADYWNRSFVTVSDPVVTQAYVLSKFLLACQMRSAMLANFCGGIFRMHPNYAAYALDYRDLAATADDQFYGNSYWWQNNRLLYQPQLAQGSADFFRSLLVFMNKLAPVMAARAENYYGAQGIYFEECFSRFGLPVMGDFGWGAKEYSEPYCRWTWQHSLEAANLMLDDYAYTRDEAFLRQTGLPYAFGALRFFETRFKRDEQGKIHIFPTHALETYWDDVVNDTPTVAGLNYVVYRLGQLPANLLTAEQKTGLARIKDILPPIPMCDYQGKHMPDNAGVYQKMNEDRGRQARANYEAPDLYTVFPFRIFSLDKKTPDIQEAINALDVMPNIEHCCWNQFGIFSARLGQAENAKQDVLGRIHSQRLYRQDRDGREPFRFPGFCGSPHDSVPDYDGMANMMTTLQEMLLQNGEHGEILLLQAWPRDWNAAFKLHAFANTTVEGEVKDGKLIKLIVTPESRRKDVVVGKTFELKLE